MSFQLAESVITPVSLFSFNPADSMESFLNNAAAQLENTMRDVANKTHDVGADVVLHAAQKTYMTVANFKVMYKAVLKSAIDRAGKNDQERLRQLAGVVQDVIAENQAALQKVDEKLKAAEQGKMWIPRLRETTRFVAVNPEGTTKATLVFKGSFSKADQKGYEPLLCLGMEDLKAKRSTNEEIAFEVSIPAASAQERTYTFLKGKLKLTYDTGHWPGSWDVSEYDMILGILPWTGKLRIVYTPTETTSPLIVSPKVAVEPSCDAWKSNVAVICPDEIPGSSAMIWNEGSQGQLSHTFVKDLGDDQQVWHYQRKDGEGSFQLVSFQKVEGAQVKEMPLPWNEDRVVQVPVHQKISGFIIDVLGFTFFMAPGKVTPNPVFTLSEIGDVYQIKGIDAEKINLAGFATIWNELRTYAAENHKQMLPQ